MRLWQTQADPADFNWHDKQNRVSVDIMRVSEYARAVCDPGHGAWSRAWSQG